MKLRSFGRTWIETFIIADLPGLAVNIIMEMNKP